MKHVEESGRSKAWGLLGFLIGLSQILPYSGCFREAETASQYRCAVL